MALSRSGPWKWLISECTRTCGSRGRPSGPTLTSTAIRSEPLVLGTVPMVAGGILLGSMNRVPLGSAASQ